MPRPRPRPEERRLEEDPRPRPRPRGAGCGDASVGSWTKFRLRNTAVRAEISELVGQATWSAKLQKGSRCSMPVEGSTSWGRWERVGLGHGPGHLWNVSKYSITEAWQ